MRLTLNITNAIRNLSCYPSKSFEFIDLVLDSKQREAIDNLSIDPSQDMAFSFCGEVKSPKLSKMLTDFIKGFGQNDPIDIQIITNILTSIASSFLESMDCNSMWFTIRVMKADDFFDTPRWHTDGFYFDLKDDNPESYQLKLAGVLRGPGTLFQEENQEMRKKYREISEQAKTTDKRKSIAEALSNYKIVSPGSYQASLFVVGNYQRAAIHSEPPINQTRLFFSIVPGLVDDIKELAERYNEPFIT